MILVTLGTQDKKFYRLLDMIQDEIDKKNIKDKVIVQAGYSSDYESSDMEIFDLIPINEFEKLIKKCDVLITHGGVGSITAGLKYNKKVIALPRLKKYKEHTNDHQVQIVNSFSNNGYILSMNEEDSLYNILKKIKNFKPKKYKSNNDNFVKLIEEKINKCLK